MHIIDPDEIAFKEKKPQEETSSISIQELGASIFADYKSNINLRKDQIKNDVLLRLKRGYRIQITDEMKELGIAEEILSLSINYGLQNRFISILSSD